MTAKSFPQRLDRVALTLILVLSGVIGLLLLLGAHAAPRIRDFSWQDKQVGAEDAAFILTFSRPMNRDSVETNLRLVPPLPGKFSWAGRRMAYTLESPAPYGTAFEVQLQEARDRFSKAGNQNTQMQPFVGRFRTRDRAFVYLGISGEAEGRLVLNNLTRQEQRILTPKNLVVMDFEPYPEGDRILFSASDRASQAQNLLNQQLYTVTTGIQPQTPASAPTDPNVSPAAREPQPAGVIEPKLDSKDYQNLKFDLSPDGQTIIVQRVNRKNPADFGLWVLKPNVPPQTLKTEPGGDFLIAPDSRSLAMAQGQGLAILPLQSDADPLDFLPKFGMILSFAGDGSAAAVVRFNADPLNPTRSLFLVTNQSTEKELLKTDGSILSAQFDPTKQTLYCLLTKRLPGEAYLEQPYLSAIDLKTAQRTDLLLLPMQRDIQMSLAPDGLGLLFDQAIASAEGDATGAVRSSEGTAIATSRLWFLPIILDKDRHPTKAEPQPLPLEGLRPRWLP